ncbi:MAG: putative acetyltransferase [Polaribacter sp.]|jgi:predicted acetyltransferase
MIVSEHPRNKGVATAILQELVIIDTRLGLKPICSTEKSNVGAQTAIARCGFVA